MRKLVFLIICITLASCMTIKPVSADNEAAPVVKPVTKSKSITAVVHPIISCFGKIEVYKSDIQMSRWQAVNSKQRWFIRRYLSPKTLPYTSSDLTYFNSKELRAWASRNHNYLNRKLRSEGFNIKFRPFYGNTFGVVSVLKVALQWKYRGKQVKIFCYDLVTKKRSVYPGVFMKKKTFKVYYTRPDRWTIAVIQTKNGDKVYLALSPKSESAPRNMFELIKKIEQQRTELRTQYHYWDWTQGYKGVKFPMVKLNQRADIKWLLNMKNNGWFISQAMQQTKFFMDHKGARVESAAAVAMTKSLPRYLYFNRPFYIWIERKGMEHPYFYGWIHQSDWKNPNK